MTAARFLRRALEESFNATLSSATEPTTSGGSDCVPVMGLYSQDDPAAAAIFADSNTTTGSTSTSTGTFESSVFWGVNAFILCLLLGMCVWCICFGGKDNLAVWTSRRAETDETYQARLRRQHEQRMAARRSTPQRRMARLKRSFQRNKVQMIVKEGDIIESDDTQQGGINQIRNDPVVPAVTQAELASTSTTLDEDDQDKEEIHNNNNDSDTASSSGSEDNQTETDAPKEDAQPPVVVDITANDDNDDSEASMMEEGVDSVAEHPTGYLVLRPGNAKVAPKDGPMVPNCCAVCLGEYDMGETVVWSCNPECKHAFHLGCIMEWLLKIEDGGTPCPCCRQEFTDWETDRQERKIKWAAGNAFDLSSIAL